MRTSRIAEKRILISRMRTVVATAREIQTQRHSFGHCDWLTGANDKVEHRNGCNQDRCDEWRARPRSGRCYARDNQKAADQATENRHQQRNFEEYGSFAFAQLE